LGTLARGPAPPDIEPSKGSVVENRTGDHPITRRSRAGGRLREVPGRSGGIAVIGD
jgi:hypothetical protein